MHHLAGDNSDENISSKTPHYCKLTCLYWTWKNLDADAIGLCHYRRYFAGWLFGRIWDRIQNGVQAEKLLSNVLVVLPKKRYNLGSTEKQHVEQISSE
jgi:hypothetical protein